MVSGEGVCGVVFFQEVLVAGLDGGAGAWGRVDGGEEVGVVGGGEGGEEGVGVQF